MTVVPDNNKIRLLINGISQGPKVLISAGGQIPPIESDGNKLALKKAQNHATKNMSDVTLSFTFFSSGYYEKSNT